MFKHAKQRIPRSGVLTLRFVNMQFLDRKFGVHMGAQDSKFKLTQYYS